MIESANDILQRWVSLTNKLDVDAITAMYSKDAQLLPTFSSKGLIGNEQIRGYFEKFTNHSSVTVTLHPKSIISRELGDSVSIVSGLYRWEVDMDEELLNFEARFTMIIAPNDKQPIKHHHSSQIPRSI